MITGCKKENNLTGFTTNKREPRHHIGLSESDIQHYERHGYVILRDVLPKSVINEGIEIYKGWLPNFIQLWREQGLLKEELKAHNILEQFYEAWESAGNPMFRRQPFKNLINEAMYNYFKNPYLLSLAEQLLKTSELSMHGVYNGRAQPPKAAWATPGWHQDAQFWDEDFGEEGDKARKTHVLALWFPLHYVDENSGCLQVISTEETKKQLFPHFPLDYDNTGFLGMDQELANTFKKEQFKMNPGDVLALSQINLHKASENNSNRMRYSYDIRYEHTHSRTTVGDKYGFIAQSIENPESETPMQEWVQRRELFINWEKENKK